MALHRAFYDTRARAGAVVHLHSCHSVALSTLPVDDPENWLPRSPYAVMQLGKDDGTGTVAVTYTGRGATPFDFDLTED